MNFIKHGNDTMTVAELIEKLETIPQDYQVVFECGDSYGSAYLAYCDDINVNNKDKQIKLLEL